MTRAIPDDLTPTERRQEIAAILGRCLLRLNCTFGTQPASSNPSPDSADQKALDVSAPGDPHVSWLRQPRS